MYIWYTFKHQWFIRNCYGTILTSVPFILMGRSLLQSKLQSKICSERRTVCDLVTGMRKCMYSRTITSRNVYDINVRQRAFRCGTCARANFSQGVVLHEQVQNNLAHCRTSNYGHLADVTIHRQYYLDCFSSNERES